MTNQGFKYFSLFLLFVLTVFYSEAQIGMIKEDGGFLFTEKGRKIAFYQKDKISMNLEPERNNFLHPVYLPDGTVITENAPIDHIHHRGIFWTWHQVLIDGKAIGDPWMLDDFEQEIKHVEFNRLPDGNGEFRTQVLWRSSQFKNSESPYMEELNTITFHQLKKNLQVILFEIELKALTENLKLGGSDDAKGYGGFSIRMKLPDDITFQGEDGLVEPQTNAVDAGQFMDMHGSIGKSGSRGGVFIYADPRNQTGSQTWILRKKNSMQNAVFPGREPVSVSTKKPLVLKYALVLYNGEINEKKLVKKIRSHFN